MTIRRRVTAVATLTAALVWAPSDMLAGAARGFVFASKRGGHTDIFVKVSGSSARQLTRNRASDYGPVSSPDGRRIAFVSDRDGDDDVYVVNLDGSGLRKLTRDARAGSYDSAPAWSPDGARIAFASTRDGGEAEIYVMRADGTKPRRLTRTPRYVSDTTPSWSPNGQRIVFASNRAGFDNQELYVMRADGRHVLRLTRSRDDDGQPAWSPGGRRIAFVSRRDRNDEIYVVNADGSHPVRLTSTTGQDEFLPRWSPSGERLVFWSTAAGRADRIWSISADGAGRRLVAAGSHADWLR